MITADHLRNIAFWAHDLAADEVEQARRGIVEKSFAKGSYVCHRGDRLDGWTGVTSGLLKLGLVSKSGKAATLAGIRAGGWFGEGSVLKDEERRYDLVALRDTRLAIMSKPTFFWLFEHSAAFNRFLVRQFNERLGQFIALAEYDRILDAPGRLARNIAWLFNPTLYRDGGRELDISQEELGLLCGMSRQMANKSLQQLESKGLLRVERNGITIVDLDRLTHYGE